MIETEAFGGNKSYLGLSRAEASVLPWEYRGQSSLSPVMICGQAAADGDSLWWVSFLPGAGWRPHWFMAFWA